MNIVRPGLDWYVDKLNDGEPFAFSRYGNGEWDLVLGRGSITGSGSQRFNDDLREAMRRTLTDMQGYQYAIQSTSYLERLGLLSEAEEWLAEQDVDIEWHDGEVFHKASRHGRLHPLIEAMQQYNVVVVGPPWLHSLPFADIFIEIPAHDCWKQRFVIEAQVRMYHDSVISFSAGPATKVMIHNLYPHNSWLIDFGSLWDVYGGKESRRYHRHMSADVIERNLRGA